MLNGILYAWGILAARQGAKSRGKGFDTQGSHDRQWVGQESMVSSTRRHALITNEHIQRDSLEGIVSYNLRGDETSMSGQMKSPMAKTKKNLEY